MKESPITPLHIELGAVMSHADGWNMPAVYTDLVDEHLAARASCGIFDVSYLCKFKVQGEGALPWLEKMFSNSVAELKCGFAHQSLMLNHQGVIIDKVTLASESETLFYLVGSAGQEQTDERWLCEHLPPQGVSLSNDTEAWCAIAVQGPDSETVFHRVFGNLPYPSLYAFTRISYKGDNLFLSRAGVFDEAGVDIYCPSARGIYWFEALLAAGAIPCGLKTREYLRMEKGLVSHEDGLGTLTPAVAGLDSLCSETKNYMGSEVTKAPTHVVRRMVTIRCTEGAGVPKRGDVVLNAQGDEVGTVTGACTTPALHYGIAMAMVDADFSPVGTPLFIKCAQSTVPAVVSDTAAA